MTQPLVSVGVPVFNGAGRLRTALDSLLAQDYGNLEIVISDNASTDETAQICDEYVRQDSRVKYWRAEQNRGAAWNFNRVFELSSGEYFMWAAHDDWRHASFVTACLEQLERYPSAVLCQAHTAMFIEGHDQILCVARLDSFQHASGLVARYRETLKRFPATAFYGVFRSSAIRRTLLLEKQIATDVAFIQELSIYGDFIQTPRLLFHYFGRARWNTVDQDYSAIFGRTKKPVFYFPFLVLLWSNLRRVGRAPLSFSTKLRLWTVLLAHELRQAWLKMTIRAVGLILPDRFRVTVGRNIYARWIHNVNVQVACADLFMERVIKPTLRWW